MATLQNFIAVPTQQITERFLEEAPNCDERELIKLHRRLFADSLSDLWDVMSGGMTGFNGYKILRLSMLFDPEDDLNDIKAALDALIAFDAWNRVQRALEDARKYFGGPFCKWALFIADRTKPDVIEKSKGIVGFGSIPPYILLGIWPTKYSLVSLQAAAAREYHHSMRHSLYPVNSIRYPLIQSLLAEGLAEVFIEEHYGEDFVIDNAKKYPLEEVKKLWPKFEKNIKLDGIDQHRSFMFGGYKSGIPTGAGFSVGYQIIKSFLENNPGTKSNEIIALPYKKIMAGSNFKIRE